MFTVSMRQRGCVMCYKLLSKSYAAFAKQAAKLVFFSRICKIQQEIVRETLTIVMRT